VIIGNVREAYAVRAAKQLFGSWRKADKLISPTFRQPEPVDTKILVVDMPGAETSEIRLAVRGLARNDKDLMAANFWTGIMEARMRAGMPANLQKRFSLRHTTNALPGIFIISASVPTEKTGETLKSLREQILKAAGEKLNQAEFARNQQAAVQAIKERAAVPGELAGLWFNSDTFKTPNFREVLNMAQTVTISDAERVAARLFKDAPVAVVIIGNAEQIQPQLDGLEAKK
ncbi:MAG TPA: insulinase family protein, partial [Pyrinomonadaceae bacterium]|nr:insulinase family protein [Pyrinomonadaceae bacterium]